MECEKHTPEQNACQSKCTAKSGIKYGDEYIGCKSRGTKPDSAAHHHSHNNIGFQIKKVPDWAKFFGISFNALCMLDTHFEEHQAEGSEYSYGKQNM